VLRALLAVAAVRAWQGTPRWWRWQLAVVVAAPVLFIATFVVMMVSS
jgi:hypothetical protein